MALIRSGGKAARAMRALGINQPAMSKRLRSVQHAGPLLDRPWLVRKGKRWELTEEGRQVWPAVVQIVDRHENLEAFLAGHRAAEPAEESMRSCITRGCSAGFRSRWKSAVGPRSWLRSTAASGWASSARRRSWNRQVCSSVPSTRMPFPGSRPR